MSLDHCSERPEQLLRRLIDAKFIHRSKHRDVVLLAPGFIGGRTILSAQQDQLLSELAALASKTYLEVSLDDVAEEFRQVLGGWPTTASGLYEVPASTEMSSLRRQLNLGDWLLVFVAGLSPSPPELSLLGTDTVEESLRCLANRPGVLAVVCSLPDDVEWLVAPAKRPGE